MARPVDRLGWLTGAWPGRHARRCCRAPPGAPSLAPALRPHQSGRAPGGSAGAGGGQGAPSPRCAARLGWHAAAPRPPAAGCRGQAAAPASPRRAQTRRCGLRGARQRGRQGRVSATERQAWARSAQKPHVGRLVRASAASSAALGPSWPPTHAYLPAPVHPHARPGSQTPSPGRPCAAHHLSQPILPGAHPPIVQAVVSLT